VLHSDRFTNQTVAKKKNGHRSLLHYESIMVARQQNRKEEKEKTGCDDFDV
jgi:hypothetical protein